MHPFGCPLAWAVPAAALGSSATRLSYRAGVCRGEGGASPLGPRPGGLGYAGWGRLASGLYRRRRWDPAPHASSGVWVVAPFGAPSQTLLGRCMPRGRWGFPARPSAWGPRICRLGPASGCRFFVFGVGAGGRFLLWFWWFLWSWFWYLTNTVDNLLISC